jgi:large subunit ribosomal protein L3
LFSEDKNNDIEEEIKDIPKEEAATEEAPKEEAATEEAPKEEANLEKDEIPLKLDFIIGKKLGMTRVFDHIGNDLPVTIVEAGPCPIVQVKLEGKEGYSSLQLGFIENKKSNKPMLGHFQKANIEKGTKILKEFRCDNIDESLMGKEVKVNSFEEGDFVSVTGVSKGKGFAGHMKRHNFAGGRASHGKNSVMRKAGSIGAGTSPGRVWKGTRMAGRMGGDSITVDNLRIIKVDIDNNLLFVKGAIPGPSKSIVYIEK